VKESKTSQAVVLAILGEGRLTIPEMYERLGLKTEAEKSRLRTEVARLKRVGKLASPEKRKGPWRLAGPDDAPGAKPRERTYEDDGEDVVERLQSKGPAALRDLMKDLNLSRPRCLKVCQRLKRSGRAHVVGRTINAMWHAGPPKISSPARAATALKPKRYRDPRSFGSDLDDQLRSRLADLDRERDAILVLLETR
jgi:hypothetical protein